MATSYTGLRVQDTYNAIIKIGDNSNLTATPKLLSDGLGNDSPLYLSGTKLGIGISPTYQFQTSGNAKIGGNLIIAGDLTVNGTTTIVDSTIVAIGDNMIEMAKDNVANTMDIGWYGTIVENGTKYVGMKYDAGSGVTTPTFELGYGTTEPSGTAEWTVKGKLVIGAIDSTGGTFSGQITIPQTPTADGHAASKKYVDDQIADVDTAKRLEVTVKNVSGGSLAKGTVVHAAPTATPPSGNVVEVIAADANVVASMPAIGVLNETIADEAEGAAVMFGAVSGIDTSSFSIGDELYVSTTAGEFTATKPTANDELIQKIAIVIKSHASNGLIKVFGAGRSNDVPNQIDRDVNFTDNSKLTFGDSTTPDLEIYHDVSNSYIRELGTGNLYIDTNGTQVVITTNATAKTAATFSNNGSVDLYYNNSKKFETTSTGVSVTGDGTFTGSITLGRNINLSSTDYTYIQGTHTGASDGEYVMRTFGYGDSTFYGSFDILRHDTDDGELRLRQRIAGTATDVLSIVDGNATFAGQVIVTNDNGIKIADSSYSTTSRTFITSYTTGGNSSTKIKGGNFIHNVYFETSWNDFNYARLSSSYNTSDSNFFLYKSNSSGGVAATTQISTGTSTFAGDISIPVAKSLYFGGGSHTYIREDIDDRLRFFVGGAEFMRFTEDTTDTINFYKPISVGGNSIDMVNGNINNVNNLTFNDPGGNKGINWNGGNLWRIFESPNDLSNAAGNLQFVKDTTRSMTLDTSGNLYTLGGLDAGSVTSRNTLSVTGVSTFTSRVDMTGTSGWNSPSYFYAAYTHTTGMRMVGNESQIDLVSQDLGEHSGSILLRGANQGFGLTNNITNNRLEIKYFVADDDSFTIHGSGTNVSTLTDVVFFNSDGSVDFKDDVDVTGTITGDLTGNVTGLASLNTPLNDIRSLGTQAFTNGTNPNITTAQVMSEIESDGGFDSFSSVFKTSWSYAGNYNLTDAGRFTETAGSSWITWTDNSSDSTRGHITALAIAPTTGGSAGKVFIYNDQGTGYNAGWREVWTNTSDGVGSGLDADLLDGEQGSYYAPATGGSYVAKAGDTMTGNLDFDNTIQARFKTDGGDIGLRIWSSGTNSFIDNEIDNLYIRQKADNKNIVFQTDNGSGGLATYLSIDGADERIYVFNLMRFADDVQLRLGVNNDIRLYHNSTDGENHIENHTGSLYITNYADDEDIIFRNDNGSGDVIEYFRLDGSTNTVPFGRSPHIVDNLKLYFGNDTANDASIRWDSTANQLFIDGSSKFLNDLSVVQDLQLGSFGNNNAEFALGQTIANKVFSYGAEIQTTNTSIQLVLGRNNGTSVDGTGAIGADSINAFHVYDTTSIVKLFEVAQTSGNATFEGNVTTGASLISTNAIVDNVVAKTTNGNIIFKNNSGSTIATFNNDLSATFTGEVISNDYIQIQSAGDALLRLNQTGTDTGWNYINWNYNGTRRWFTGLNSAKQFGIYNDNVDGYNVYFDWTTLDSHFGGNATFQGHIVPSTDSTYDLGSTTNYWRSVYADDFYGTGTFHPLSLKTKVYNTSNTSSSVSAGTSLDDEYELLEFGEMASPVYLNIKTAAHSSASFVITRGYFGNNTASILCTGSTYTANGGYANLRGIRVIKDNNNAYKVIVRLYRSGSHSGFSLYARAWGGTDSEDIDFNTTLTDTFTESVALGGISDLSVSTSLSAAYSRDTLYTDNALAAFGNAKDLQIYHDGSNSYIKDTGTGNLWIQGSTQVNIGGANGEIGIQYVENANVTLRHNNVAKLTTTSTGISVTGDITTSGTNATVKADRFSGIGTGVVIGPNSNGTVFLRPEGVGGTNSQSTFTTALATIGTDATFAGSIKLEGPDGGLVFRNWTANSGYASIATNSMTNLEYALLTDGTDTFLSGGTGGFVSIRGGNNDSSNELRIDASGAKFYGTVIPSNNATQNFGSTTNRWNVGYFSSLSITNVVTNKILKFDGTDIDDSIMTDDGTTVSVAGNLSVTGNVSVTSGLLGVYSKFTQGIFDDSNGIRILNPGGGSSNSLGNSNTQGAIKITLPVSWTNTMMRMTIKVYDYSTNDSFTLVCGGYNYSPSASWINEFAYIESAGNVDVNYTIRFGHDGSKCCVYIGELTTYWSYPKVYVTDVQLGFSGLTSNNWRTGWSISMETSAFGTITHIESNPQVNNWVRNGSSLYRPSGDIGIGISNPSHKMHITSSTANNLVHLLEQDNASYQAYYEAKSQNSGYVRFGIGDDADAYAFFNTSVTSYNWYHTGGGLLMTLNSNGHLGLGITNLTFAKLAVNGATYSSGGTFNAGTDTVTDAAFVVDEEDWIYTRDSSQYARKLIGKTNDIIQIGQSGTSYIQGIEFYSGSDQCNYKWYRNTSVAMQLTASGSQPYEILDVKGRIQAETDNGSAVNVPRSKSIPYQGASGYYDFDPVAEFGQSKSGGYVLLEVNGWQTRFNAGYIHWNNNGSSTGAIGTGSVTYRQIAWSGSSSGAGVTVSLPSSSTNIIRISFSGWHSNNHGWTANIINRW